MSSEGQKHRASILELFRRLDAEAAERGPEDTERDVLTIRAIVQARTARRPAGPAAIASVRRDWQKRLPALSR